MTTVFSEEAVTKFGENYQTKVRPTSRGGCMRAVYIGLGTLYGDEFDFKGSWHRSFFRKSRQKEKRRKLKEGRLNTIDRVFADLADEGILFEAKSFRPKRDSWKSDEGLQIESVEASLVDQVSRLPDGSHFFGAAVSGAIHSIIIRVHKLEDSYNVYWMDQFSKGYDEVRKSTFTDRPDVTRKLDATLRKLGSDKTTIWMFNPEGASDIGIDVDSDGDGIEDMTVRAVTEVDDLLTEI